jgi:hypothetical protein
LELLIVGRRGIGAFAIVFALTGCAVTQTSITPAASYENAVQTTGALLYVANGSAVLEYSLPGGKLENTLTGFNSPENPCSDAKGDVFVPDFGASDVVEYSHGGTAPKKTWNDSGERPLGCAVNSTTGDLAVTNWETVGSSPGELLVYESKSGKPKAYHDSKFDYFAFCTYDDKGNLFVVGYDGSFYPSLAELSKGRHHLTNITLNSAGELVYWTLWSGSALTVLVYAPGQTVPLGVYRVKISGSKGTLYGKVSLRDDHGLTSYAFYGGELIGIAAQHPPKGTVTFWPYPKGGNPTKHIGESNPSGLTVSAPRK